MHYPVFFRRKIVSPKLAITMSTRTSEGEILIIWQVAKYFRLLDLPSSTQDRKRKEFVELSR